MKNCPKTGLAVAGPFKRERGGRLFHPCNRRRRRSRQGAQPPLGRAVAGRGAPPPV